MVVDYLRERFRTRVFVPLALLIGAAASAPPAAWTGYALDAGFALLLLAQFRVWDDLADRGRDAVAHPTRVLVRAAAVTQVVAFCGALAVLNICLAVWHDASGIAVGVLAALDAALGAWYLARTGRTAAGEHLLLAKYPAMIVIVAGARVFDAPIQVLSMASVLYLAVCAYEVLHDPASPLARGLSIGGHS